MSDQITVSEYVTPERIYQKQCPALLASVPATAGMRLVSANTIQHKRHTKTKV
jgi:hypothetical protein